MSESTMPYGQVCWLEVPVEDAPRAQKFYTAVLGWTCKSESMMRPPVGGIKELYEFNAGPLFGAFLLMEEGHHVINLSAEKELAMPLLPTFCVESIEETLKKAEELGGKTKVGKTLISAEMGYFARMIDTEGNLVGIYAQK